MKIEKKYVASPKGDVAIYRLTNASGASIEVSSIGAGLISVSVPDRDGVLANVILGYANPADSLYDGPCAGKVPGRYANRIAKGHLVVGGKTYQLAINNGPNALHGGPEGFQNQVWNSEVKNGKVVFSHYSPDGDEHYPGNLTATVIYSWSDDNKITIDMRATCDADTVVNLTNHTYFNLRGEGSGTALDHELMLNCSRYLPTDDSLIPTGEIAPVAGTPMDFTLPKMLGRDIKQDFPALRFGKGYDNCWVIDAYKPGELKEAAVLSEASSGRVLHVATTQPALQVYTGNWLKGCPVGRCGRSYDDYEGVAMECQGMPDAPNKPQFPSQALKAGEEYHQIIEFSFKTK
jgi:aldose 1-epimerase